MICKKCGARAYVTNSYATPDGRTQRFECPRCFATIVSVSIVVALDPPEGKGACALANRLKEGVSPWDLLDELNPNQ